MTEMMAARIVGGDLIGTNEQNHEARIMAINALLRKERIANIINDVSKYHAGKAEEEAVEGSGAPILHLYAEHVLDDLLKAIQRMEERYAP